LSRFLSRQDWRERDVLHLILDFIQGSMSLYEELILNTLFALKRLQEEDTLAYNRALAALINEGRGYLGELPCRRHRLFFEEGPDQIHLRGTGETGALPAGSRQPQPALPEAA
jgi:hypothetical protein